MITEVMTKTIGGVDILVTVIVYALLCGRVAMFSAVLKGIEDGKKQTERGEYKTEVRDEEVLLRRTVVDAINTVNTEHNGQHKEGKDRSRVKAGKGGSKEITEGIHTAASFPSRWLFFSS